MLLPKVASATVPAVRGRLLVVCTPLGCAEDITIRAARTLLSAKWIACEDTRVTRKLVERLKQPDLSVGVENSEGTRYISVREENELASVEKVTGILMSGEDVAYCTDAGAPGVSDPGRNLVEKIREAGFHIKILPGASAVTAAAAASGMPTDRFYFAGFLPAKKNARRKGLEEIRTRKETIVLFEAPHRMQELMEDAAEILGERNIVVCREMTKEHEEIVRTTTTVAARREDWRGEITIVMTGSTEEPAVISEDAISDFLRGEISTGATVRDAVDHAVSVLGVARRDAYRLALSLKESKS